jgi:UDP-N-acetylmuramoyl-tripeptide--D-alanyl-D-alanine ligase
MYRFDPNSLSRWCDGSWTDSPSKGISGFTIDSRKVSSGDMFVAIKADRDGHDYLDQACKEGAIAGLVDHQVGGSQVPQLVVGDTLLSFQRIAKEHRAQFSGKVVGVTGSCGKTSTKEILKTLLDQSLCTEGNLNNFLGVPLTLTQVCEGEHRFAVVEAGINQMGEMDVLTDMICPNLTIITSIGHSHLEGLQTIENVAKEKIRLWTHSAEKCLGIFPEELVHYDCFRNAISEERPCILVKKGGAQEEVQAPNQVLYNISTETNEGGHSNVLNIERFECPLLSIPIQPLSDGLIRNMVLACVAAWKLGASDKEIFERLPQYCPSGLRGSNLVGRGRSYLVDCYNANPASMMDSIEYFRRKFRNKPKLLVLGGMNELGNLSQKLHFETGKAILMDEKDRAILIGGHARQMAQGMIDSGARLDQLVVLENAEDGRPLIEEFDGPVLLKGSRSFRLEELVPKWAVELDSEQVGMLC